MQQTQNIIHIVNGYAIECNSIRNYVPDADVKEIYIVNGLKKFLDSNTEIEATGAIIEGNGYFQEAIGYDPSHSLFDSERLKALVKKYAVAAVAQKQMSTEQLLAQMRDYQALVLKQESEKSDLSVQVHTLNNLVEATVQNGINNASVIKGRSTKKRYEDAIRMMKDPSFKMLQGSQQTTILNDVIIAGESPETAYKRRLINIQKEKE